MVSQKVFLWPPSRLAVSDVLYILAHTTHISSMPYIAFPAIHCPDLEHLSHGDVISNGTTFESTAEIICHDGYRLDDGTSSTTVSCQSNATWNHQNVFCEGKHDP